jgi:hypothetical protein
VPDVNAWTEALPAAYDVTIVDVAWDAWQTWAGTPTPATAWLTAADTTPVVVLRATRRGLTQLEGVLAAAAAAAAANLQEATAQVKALVSVSAATWPPEVLASASPTARELLACALTLPWDVDLERYGLTTAPTPPELQGAALMVLAELGVAVVAARASDGTRHRRLAWPRGLRGKSEGHR